ncbi:MAG: Flp pilus assembly complex ATPase component TadA [Candidatus Marinimicrobia bacterium]|jgi:type IV pilus assembly protein PilB|nr:Flp pilus assembly complex ATPase component TadA [Candidatus Neomarinimicrobiota bacterium]MBT3848126.1 Flp pilus assembly complex ATPase component TadA [Candidatus Neomarinimicrobiota bacterium]MBT4154609.1 Flp pilus assembly complex ATPase component TadA [Candidatus Neomarinimicrobiota bacterium]MBT4555320.1 Flp pilus assembly complex ATPase component TadA [Candidatus Neomarinimicrobiota bacterium]MBT4753425.1 Flp pilus assembly complex ATPase component TadA [Candidatus Neomarinimicrobiota|tara:strand:- start:1903 stop:3624 length:1722 start_codon:yes stop_codon:yes gene_type:complete
MSTDFNPQFSKIGEILIHQEKISESQLNQALAEQKNTQGKLGQTLIEMDAIREEVVTSAFALQMGYKVADNFILLEADPNIASMIPEDFARSNRVLAVNKNESSIVVAMEDPEDLITVDAIKRLTNLDPDILVSGTTLMEKALDKVYGEIQKTAEVSETIESITVISGDEGSQEKVDLSPEKASAEDAPIVKLVNLILIESIKERATDIHIEPMEKQIYIRIRIDGVLQTIMTPPITSLSGLVTRIKILSNLNIAEKRLPQDGRFSINSPGKDLDVRVSILPTIYGEKIVMRLLDKTGFDINLKSLGFPQQNLGIFKKIINQPYGMVVVSGPTGSGKSTSLYAALKEIKSDRTNITTVEDPVEYQLDGINQVQVFEDIGLTFGSTLRSVLRQDPDILLIGEIRDGETADIAVKFALTGHLVFSTVHANDAPGTITRLLDIGIAPFLVGSCLNLVMAQRLVRRICLNCKENYTPSREELDLVGLDPGKVKGDLFQGKGCADCRNTGYKGRLAIFEMIPMARELRKLVFDSANEDDIRESALKNGMITLREAGLSRVLEGITTVEEIVRSTVEDL